MLSIQNVLPDPAESGTSAEKIYRSWRWYFSLKRKSLSSSCSLNKGRILSKMTPPGMLMLIPIESPLLPSSTACNWGVSWPAEELACKAGGKQQQHFQHLGSKGVWNALPWWNLPLLPAPSVLLRRRLAGAEPGSHINIEGGTTYEIGWNRACQQLDFGFEPHAPLKSHYAVRRRPQGHACFAEALRFPESKLKRLQVDSRHDRRTEHLSPPCIAGVDCWKIKFVFPLPFHNESDWPIAKLRFHHCPKASRNGKLLLEQGHLKSPAFCSRILILAPEGLNVTPLEALVIWPIEVDGLAKEFEGRVRVCASHDSGKLIRVHINTAEFLPIITCLDRDIRRISRQGLGDMEKLIEMHKRNSQGPGTGEHAWCQRLAAVSWIRFPLQNTQTYSTNWEPNREEPKWSCIKVDTTCIINHLQQL